MPRGDKDKYTDKEKRQAQHIEEGYEERGVPEDEAERRAWGRSMPYIVVEKSPVAAAMENLKTASRCVKADEKAGVVNDLLAIASRHPRFGMSEARVQANRAFHSSF